MSFSAIEIEEARAQSVQVKEDVLVVELVDGRTIMVPLVWYPRLWYGKPEERSNLEIIGDGGYIHWPQLDEDLSIAGMLAGRRSGESPDSLKKWLARRGPHSRESAKRLAELGGTEKKLRPIRRRRIKAS
ncbi:MAG: DUF2442 domain-containing protein [Candidatus Hydrogenedentes bacterium]|nr:DUF2442 domain-containing protein [Candidatus Hydrogenedentota bacterium]